MNEVASNTMKLGDFVETFKSALLSAVKHQCPPRFTEAVNSDERLLLSLKRRPYPAQAKVIHAMKQLLLGQDERAGIINGDMGTGKVRRVGAK